MKKIIYIIILFFLIIPVNAKEPANLIALTNKCGVIKDNTLIVPINIVSTNDGGMSKLISEYTLGKIENQDNFTITIKNIENKNLNNVTIDKLKDSNNYSNVKYTINNDIELKKGESLANINIEVQFNEEIPASIYILGNTIKISDDESVCELINGYKVELLEYETMSKNNFLYVAIAILLILVIIEHIILFKHKGKK